MDAADSISTCDDGPPVGIDPAWLTEAVCGLAAGIVADRGFDRLPILADALEDAGCADDAVLSHCRECRRHAAGCWVVRGILDTHLPPTVTLVVAPPPEQSFGPAVGRGETGAAWVLAGGLVISLAAVVAETGGNTESRRAAETSAGPRPSRPLDPRAEDDVPRHAEAGGRDASGPVEKRTDAPRSPIPVVPPPVVLATRPISVREVSPTRFPRPRLLGRLFRR